MKTQLKGVLFDLDDTLINWDAFTLSWREHEAYHLAKVYDYLVACGHPPNVPFDVLRDAFGRLVKDAWSQARATLRSPSLEKCLEQLLTDHGVRVGDHVLMNDLLLAYNWGIVEGVTLHEDVPPALQIMLDNGVKTGIVTNAFYPMWMRDMELEQYNLLQFFPHAPARITAVDAGYLKPHPNIFKVALDGIGLSPEEVVFVGDNPVADVAGAQAIGMKAVLRQKKRTSPHVSNIIVPDATIDNFNDLLAVLDGWYAGWR